MKFLKAEWRDLVVVNWEIPKLLIEEYVPGGTELDLWDGKLFLSLVGFRFVNTKVLGLPIPFHRNFEEVNLRFYVKRECEGECRRGVVFVRELVPLDTIAFVARNLYNENYLATSMSHHIAPQVEEGMTKLVVGYSWQYQGKESRVEVVADSACYEMEAGSFEEFILEHYWGYTAQPDGGTKEYQVEHPRWQISPGRQVSVICQSDPLYGGEISAILNSPPHSAFFTRGSEVTVGFGKNIDG